MERESTGTKYMAANCGGSQSPSRAAELRKKKKRYNRPICGRRAEWTQFDYTPHN
jgi:predicted RNA-binding Zn-ribbon protein involved in translation (DUF1610 family)